MPKEPVEKLENLRSESLTSIVNELCLSFLRFASITKFDYRVVSFDSEPIISPTTNNLLSKSERCRSGRT